MGDFNNRRKRWITDWWPNRLNLKILRQHLENPYGEDYDYANDVQKLDIDAVIRDIKELMKSHRIGGLQISVIMVPSSFVWLGIVLEATESLTEGVAQEMEAYDFHPVLIGRIT